MLIPPTWNKVLGAFLADVWDSAVAALRTATRIIVIGYSIPETDLHFKFLLATGLQDNVSLRKIIFVNPDSEGVSQRVTSLFRPELRLVEVVPNDTHNLFSSGRSLIARPPVSPFL